MSSLLPSRYFQKINTLNVSLQGKGDVLTKSETITAFQRKLILWRQHFENGCLEMFPSLCDFVWLAGVFFVAEHNEHVSSIKPLVSVNF